MVRFILDASALSAQQQVDYTADLDRNLGIANQLTHNPSLIELYTDSPNLLILPAGVKILSREG